MSGISLITIGTELLKGRIVNTNASQIGSMLRPHGFNLSRTVVIPDEADAIRNTLVHERAHHEVVILSGGLGPTDDDITKKMLCEVLDTELTLHEPTLRYLKERYAKKGRIFSDRNRQQAMLPASCTVLPNPMGTAPGMRFYSEGSWIFSLPGVPFEMLYLMENAVIPFLLQEVPVGYFNQEILRLAQIAESDTADRIQRIAHELPSEVDIAYLPRRDGIWLEIFVGSPLESERPVLEQALHLAKDRLSSLFADKLYTLGDQPASKLIKDLFLSKGLSLSVAESMTGGGIAADLVSQPGASTYFKGGICAYDTAVKIEVLGVPEESIQHAGVVSQEVAEHMAIQVRKLLKSDVGLATTGYAEDQEHTSSQVWIGYADESGSTSLHLPLYGNRSYSMARALQYGLIFCMQQVDKASKSS